jgi:hypothetical protein
VVVEWDGDLEKLTDAQLDKMIESKDSYYYSSEMA